jgi:hypothetical protein
MTPLFAERVGYPSTRGHRFIASLLLHGAKEASNPHPRPRLRRSSRAITAIQWRLPHLPIAVLLRQHRAKEQSPASATAPSLVTGRP